MKIVVRKLSRKDVPVHMQDIQRRMDNAMLGGQWMVLVVTDPPALHFKIKRFHRTWREAYDYALNLASLYSAPPVYMVGGRVHNRNPFWWRA